ncbi:ribosomal protein S18-alanine N-acetyltransferase [Hathewaya histolytica]|uniref:[Ribosomal protein bS18]-alanine N-acetyltransferase n=1 Tax=Hathewaya histolytica TaxID=1498 RepID=A0A4U9RSU0_HATHI|nr:ribosomal protein S18-alanine N-acetyltransferase [Hathewaya histolytica]VTQ94023.1 30S ribosomal protein S18P alanine acetyltransferase [Hathewaya histolytica]
MNSCKFVFKNMELCDIEDTYLVNTLSLKVPWSIESFNDELNNNLAHYIVCKCGKSVIAFAGMWIITDEAHITNVAVHPKYRKMGIGSSLIKELKKICIQHSVLHMTLEVRESNLNAQRLYLREGFKNCGIRKSFYTSPIENAIIMWSDII